MKEKGIPKIGLILCVSFLVIVEACTVFLMYKSSNDKNSDLATVSLREGISNKETFAILLEQSDGTYKESDTWPTSGYTYNAELSGCIDVNGEKLENVLGYEDGVATVDTVNTSYCYLYFSLSTT